jgi:hypothetical protein
MLSSFDPRKRSQRQSAPPRRVWRLSDPNALARVAKAKPFQDLVDLFAEPTPVTRTPQARARLEAVPDVNQLVKLEVETRQRLQAEVQVALQEAVQKLGLVQPPPSPRQGTGSAFAWMLLGLALGALVVFVLMGRAPHAPQAAEPPRPVPSTSPVCVAAEIAPVPVASAVPLADLPAIPTFSVSDLPKPKPKPLWVPPRRAPKVAVQAPPDPPSPADEDNPYDAQ